MAQKKKSLGKGVTFVPKTEDVFNMDKDRIGGIVFDEIELPVSDMFGFAALEGYVYTSLELREIANRIDDLERSR